MSDDKCDDLDDDENEGRQFEEVDLKYAIYTDEPNMTVYLKFSGFHAKEDLDAFAEYIESYLPLILFDSDTKH